MADHCGALNEILPEQPGPARQHEPETIASAGNSTAAIYMIPAAWHASS